jgi:hypothetical protein
MGTPFKWAKQTHQSRLGFGPWALGKLLRDEAIVDWPFARAADRKDRRVAM